MIIIILSIFFLSCNDFQQTEKQKKVARVNSTYLYLSDLENEISPQLSYVDSVIVARSIIDDWAIKNLIYNQSTLHLHDSIQKKLTKMVENYKLQLWTNTYRNYLSKSNFDNKIDSLKKIDFYKKNKVNFKLKDDFYNVSYIILPSINNNLKMIISRFRNFSNKDIIFLDSLNYQFNDFSINKTAWINKYNLTKKIPPLNISILNSSLKKRDFFVFKDSLQVYLLKVFDFKEYKTTAPYEIVEGNIERILINRKKLNFFKNFDKEILDDAIQTNKLEFFP
tara:strand:+ start:12134 stop:12973 length:840 start_codon:yes stop_codon:yes gene_type:complete